MDADVWLSKDTGIAKALWDASFSGETASDCANRLIKERDAYRDALMAAVQIIGKHDPIGTRRWLKENGT